MSLFSAPGAASISDAVNDLFTCLPSLIPARPPSASSSVILHSEHQCIIVLQSEGTTTCRSQKLVMHGTVLIRMRLERLEPACSDVLAGLEMLPQYSLFIISSQESVMGLERDTVLSAIRSVLEPWERVHAMWEGGAAAFDRVDEWSDIDLQVLCDDESVEDVFLRVEEALADLSPVEIRYRVPEPAWHGFSQAFYRLKDGGPFLLIDFVVMKKSSTKRLREQEIHGRGPVHFNKGGALQEEHINPADFAGLLQKRVEQLPVTFDLFQSTVTKELNRGNGVEALQFYQSMTLRPLLEALRIQHAPARFNFHTRYFYYDLPEEIIERLEPLYFIADMEDLREKHAVAVNWFGEVIDEIDMADVRAKLKAG